MTAVLMGLPDEEIKQLARQLRWRKKETYAPAETWFDRHHDSHPELQRAPSGTYLIINAEDNTWALGKSHTETFAAYNEIHGPTPRSGRHFLCITLR